MQEWRWRIYFSCHSHIFTHGANFFFAFALLEDLKNTPVSRDIFFYVNLDIRFD